MPVVNRCRLIQERASEPGDERRPDQGRGQQHHSEIQPKGLASGADTEPIPELCFRNFTAALVGHAVGIARIQPPASAREPAE